MGAIHEEAPVKIGSEVFAGFPNHWHFASVFPITVELPGLSNVLGTPPPALLIIAKFIPIIAKYVEHLS